MKQRGKNNWSPIPEDTSIGAAIFILTLNHVDVIGDQSDAVTQNAWFLCALCAAISGEISILIQTGAESWGRFCVPRICRWESTLWQSYKNFFYHTQNCSFDIGFQVDPDTQHLTLILHLTRFEGKIMF